MIKRNSFKAEDLTKVDTLPLDECLTHILSHIVRCAGNKEKLSLIREGLYEIEGFISECIDEVA